MSVVTSKLTVFYAPTSPWTFLGWARLREIVSGRGADADWRPIFMAPVFEASGGLPLGKRAKQRQAYRLMELERWRKRLATPLNLRPRFFPADDRLASRMVIAHQQRGGDVPSLSEAVMAAVWQQERDIADPDALRAIAAEQGLDGEALLAAADAPEVQARYDENTRHAIESGVFGVPTVLIGDELFWGQDRLDFVDEALAANRSD